MPRPIVLLALFALAPLYSGAQSLSDSTDIDAYLKQTIATSKIPAVVAMVADADTCFTAARSAAATSRTTRRSASTRSSESRR